VTRPGKLHALSATDGRLAWAQDLEGEATGGPWLARGRLWYGLKGREGDYLVAANLETGAESWRVQLPARLSGSLGEYRDLVLVPTSGRDGRLFGFRPGQSARILDLRADSPLRSGPVVFDDEAVVLASDGRVLAWEILRTER
jgi:outer membrane protein assembly factor BamB